MRSDISIYRRRCDLIQPNQPMKSWNSTKTRPAHRELHALLTRRFTKRGAFLSDYLSPRIVFFSHWTIRSGKTLDICTKALPKPWIGFGAVCLVISDVTRNKLRSHREIQVVKLEIVEWKPIEKFCRTDGNVQKFCFSYTRWDSHNLFLFPWEKVSASFAPNFVNPVFARLKYKFSLLIDTRFFSCHFWECGGECI